MNKHYFPCMAIFAGLTIQACNSKQNEEKMTPNILFIFMDDMGFGDLGCYGNLEVSTPNIDRLAEEGIRFHQFYANSPICSPSRTAVITGQYPSRWGITTYISSRADNEERGIKNYLDLSAPSIGRKMQEAGYYTAHIGKWHLGGGRDIGEAPLIMEYGFNESLTQFEGLGDRYLATYETLDMKDSTRSLEKCSAELGRGEIMWAKRENFTRIFIDRTIAAIQNSDSAGRPFYINLWPDDIHTPLEPPMQLRGDLSIKARFLGVMEEMDKQMGRLFEYIRSDPELSINTLIIFTSDNGPDMSVNNAGHLRGWKTNLYEGGIREPFIVWWPNVIPAEKKGTINRNTVIAGIDLPFSLQYIATGNIDNTTAWDGELMVEALTGKNVPMREKPLFWLRPPDRPGYHGVDDPDLAMRKGDFKLLMDIDSSDIQLYNIVLDESESANLVDQEPELTQALMSELLQWYYEYPHSMDTSKIVY